MTNEQYSNMMVAFAKLEAKIEKLEKILQTAGVTSVTTDPKGEHPEDLSNLWNEATARQFNNLKASME